MKALSNVNLQLQDGFRVEIPYPFKIQLGLHAGYDPEEIFLCPNGISGRGEEVQWEFNNIDNLFNNFKTHILRMYTYPSNIYG
jgi:hypothetical protein